MEGRYTPRDTDENTRILETSDDRGDQDSLEILNFPTSFLIPHKAIKLKKKIAKGYFSEVYLGKYESNVVAVKCISDIDDKSFELFKREVIIMKKLSHPRIATIYGGYIVKKLLYGIVMEYIEGGNLYKLLKDETQIISWKELLKIARDVAEGMTYVHSQNVIHGDLKSQNIMIENKYGTFRAKICDFGLAKERKENGEYEPFNTTTNTHMAPELFLPKKFGFIKAINTKSTDVYAFGTLLWELGTRERPFLQVHHTEIPELVVEGKREEISPDTPKNIQTLIEGCWNLESKKRPTMNRVWQLLDDERTTLKEKQKGEIETVDHGYWLPCRSQTSSQNELEQLRGDFFDIPVRAENRDSKNKKTCNTRLTISSTRRTEYTGLPIDFEQRTENRVSQIGFFSNKDENQAASEEIASRSFWDSAVEKFPDQPAYHYGRGMVLIEEGRREEAIAEFTEAFRCDPTHVESLVQRGFTHENLGNTISGLHDYNQALELDPNNYLALYRSAGLLMRMEGESKKLKDEKRPTLYRRLSFLAGKKEKSEAEKRFEAALKIKNDDFELYRLRGECYLDRKNYEEAIRDFDMGLFLIAHDRSERALRIRNILQGARDFAASQLCTESLKEKSL